MKMKKLQSLLLKGKTSDTIDREAIIKKLYQDYMDDRMNVIKEKN
jgi:hypothetical protein